MHKPKGNLQLKLQPMVLNLLLKGQQLTRSLTFAQPCDILEFPSETRAICLETTDQLLPALPSPTHPSPQDSSRHPIIKSGKQFQLNTSHSIGKNAKATLLTSSANIVTSSTIPNSTISKRHHLASYHRVREAIAAKFISFHWKDGKSNPADILSKHWEFATVWPMLKPILLWRGDTATQLKGSDRNPSTNPGADPPRYARDSGSARSHSTHLETNSSDRP